MDSVEGPVQRQLDAYNARDLRRFLAGHSDHVVVFRPPVTAPAIVGKDALGAHYAHHARGRFNLPTLHARLLSRIVSGDTLVDQEEVTGVLGGAVSAVAAYKVKDWRIRAVWSF